MLKVLYTPLRVYPFEYNGGYLSNMRASSRDLCMRRNQQGTTTHSSSCGDKKIRQTDDHHRRHRQQRPRLGQIGAKDEDLLRVRRHGEE